MIEKFYSKLWTLRFLKRSGLAQDKLLSIYYSIVRSAVEYCSIVYHSLIPGYLIERLELLQKQAMRTIYGTGLDYRGLVETGRIETLESRREAACLKFALKNCQTVRFDKKWFPLNGNEREARSTTRRKYKEKNCRTERALNNPLQYMIRLLNKEAQGT